MSHPRRAAPRPRLLTGWLGLALVLLLDVLAVSPAAHAWFHPPADQGSACAGHAHSSPGEPLAHDSEHACVVFHFAAGHALIELPPAIAIPEQFVVAGSCRNLDWIAPHAARFLQPPVCGPPGAGVIGT